MINKIKDLKFEYLNINNLKKFFVSLDFYKKNHIFKKNKKYFKWRFFNKKNIYNILILKFKKKIISFLCFYNLSHYDKNLNNQITYLSLAFSEKNIIPGQLYLLINKLINNNKSKIIFTSPHQAVLKLNQKIGFKVRKMNHFFFRKKTYKKNSIASFNNFNLTSKKINLVDVEYKIINEKNVHEINEGIFKHQFPEKSKEYILNRFIKHPVDEYKIISSFNKKKIKNILILKIIKHKKNRVGRIIEYIGRPSQICNFNNFLLKLIDEKNLEYIDFYCYGIKKKYLQKVGFFDKSDYPKIIIPDYFNPFFKKNIDLYFGYKSEKNLPYNLNFFKSDCDLDTPIWGKPKPYKYDLI